MSVRWPEGEELFLRLHQKLATFPNAKPLVARLSALTDLIYPELRDLATESGASSLGKNHAQRSSQRIAGNSGRPASNHQRSKNGAPMRLTTAR
jgi:hypothetical protein